MSERREIAIEVENIPFDLSAGVSGVRRQMRRLLNVSRSVGASSLSLVEQQVDSIVTIGEKLRDEIVAPEAVEKSRGEGVLAAFRGDGHRLVDLAADVAAHTLHTAADILDELVGAEASVALNASQSKPTSDLTALEGIGDVYAARFRAAGIFTLEQLLEAGATRAGRETVAEQTNISSRRILTWVNHADLHRVVGVGEQYAELLEIAGVDSVPELAQRNPANLHARLVEVNDEHDRVRHLPSVDQVAGWVTQARKLPRIVTH